MDSAVPIADRTGHECSDRTGTFTVFGNFAGTSAARRVNPSGFESASAHADLRPRYRDSQRHAAGGYGAPAA